INWHTWFPTPPAPDTEPPNLPTYPFQRQRYWMAGDRPAGDVSAAGLRPVGHPHLSAATGLADGGVLLTGVLPAAGNAGWLGEHEVADVALLPGAALVEWALRAADESGCGGVEELTLQLPLTLSPEGELRVQVLAEAPDGEGRRAVSICSQPAPAAVDGWTVHATGTLAPPVTGDAAGMELAGAWPPPGAEPLDIGGLYAGAEAAGYRYGSAFQGVQAAWRHGADLLAEVALPDADADTDTDTGEFGIHPALLDATLHPAALGGRQEEGQLWLPFTWSGVTLHAAGARHVRVRLRGGGNGGRELGVVVADAAGAPVFSAEAVAMRPADGEALRAAQRRSPSAGGLYTVEWQPLPAEAPAPDEPSETWASLGTTGNAGAAGRRYADVAALLDALDAGEPAPPVVLASPDTDRDAETDPAAVRRALRLLQEWLAQPRLLDSRLVLVTSAPAVSGLVRAVQAEHPGRFTLVDPRAGESPAGAVRRALDADEPQLAIGPDGAVSVPRLTPAAEPDAAEAPDLSGGTVVISGGTGVLGGLIAEHLVRAYGAERLLLLSRRGADAPEAAGLLRRLAGLGAHAEVAAVDVADHAALADTLAALPAGHPPIGVVHAAGVIDDALVAAWDDDRLARVWTPKVEGAWNLHALTRGLPLRMFVVFSSAAGVVGNAGQAGYAAANAWCDALVARRRADGLPGTSVAWTLWQQTSAMTGHLTQADLARLAGAGSRPVSTPHALRLFDAALHAGHPLVVAADLDATRLGPEAPAMLRALARPARRRAADLHHAGGGPALPARLAGLDPDEQRTLVLQAVRQLVTVVLGHTTNAAIREEAAFKELGFDSLTGVELRNRLAAATGLRLPATLVFDYPTPRTLADHLLQRLTATATANATPTPGRRAAAADEPIAVVAMACRFPGGVTSPEGLWELVAQGRHVLGPFPANRGWDTAGLLHPDPDHPGTTYAAQGAFVYDAETFDAAFFGINPREALAMDPQQRMLLETAWEVLERAGIDPHTLKDSLTGVYAGVMYHDYAAGVPSGDPRLDGYGMMASAGSVISGRVAYTLGLQGPAVTVDTACSSSLVAMHMAAQALRAGECELALAGGVTVLATPEVFTGFSRQRGLAPDGRCKPFAAAADGTGFGEGSGLVLLERLSDARRNGHQVLAVIRGSAVNQDGASNGLTAPNGPSQQRVITQALASAGLSPADIDAVEAHGTGTTLGDPIEAQALLATYGQERADDRPLWIGSVKSNLGHTQAAAGIAGVIKTIMALRHGRLPASLHVDAPTPHVDWDSGNVRVLTEPADWPETGARPRRAAVSSFGASGTNAHLILEQGPDEPAPAPDDATGGVVPWPLSARSEEALRAQASALAERLGTDEELPVRDVGWSLATTRATFERRAVVVGGDRAELTAALGALAEGLPHPRLVTAPPATAAPAAGQTVWLFSGQGSQRPGMGAALHARFPVFADAFDEVCALLDPHLDHPLADVVLRFEPDPGLLDHTTYTQAGLFALQVALARLLRAHGLRPDAVIGHSIGEIAAAHVAGVFSLQDACRLVAARATALGALPPGGAMTALEATAEEAAELLAPHDGQVTVAALNAPTSTVISGPAGLVAQLTADWKQQGRRAKALTVSHAFHSPLMEPALDGFHQAIADLRFQPPTIPLISNLTGQPAGEEIVSPDYWVRHVRQPVHFHPAIAHTAPHTAAYLEIGPDAVLTPATQNTLDALADELAHPPLLIPALTRTHPEPEALAHALARLHTHTPVDWRPWFGDGPATRAVDLPTYPFQRQPFWVAPAPTGPAAPASTALAHPLLTATAPLADGGLLLTGQVPAADHAGWLTEHAIADTTLLPATALLELALHAADHTAADHVEELLLQQPLTLDATDPLALQVMVGAPDDSGHRTLDVYTRPRSRPSAEWTHHASATLATQPSTGQPTAETLAEEAWPPPGAERVDVTGFYERAAAGGYHYGPAYQGLKVLWRHGDDLLAEIALPDGEATDALALHPALLDAALHPPIATADPTGETWLPFSWSGVTLHATAATHARVRITPRGDHEYRLTLTDPAGQLVLTADAITTRPIDAARLRKAESGSDGLYRVRWTALPVAAGREAPPADGWAALGEVFADSLTHYPDLGALVAALDDGAPVPPVVLVAGNAVADTLTAAQEWLAEPRLADARLVVVTRDAVAVDEASDVEPDAAAVWGLLRSAHTENPGRFALLDHGGGNAVDALRAALDADEWQLALRDGATLVPRLTALDATPGIALPVGTAAWQLVMAEQHSGTVDDVVPEERPEALEPLAPGQVRIAVRAAGINFRDVMVTLGVVPDRRGLGGEGAG
ncbi:beta-ketoacyl synthase N-terminal-like domain-containing protein, partial [Streptomyces sp. NPDC000941]